MTDTTDSVAPRAGRLTTAWRAIFGEAKQVPEHIDLAVDRDGNRFTTHVFAREGDPWYGATILMPSMVERLRDEGRLPLTECVILPGSGDDA